LRWVTCNNCMHIKGMCLLPIPAIWSCLFFIPSPFWLYQICSSFQFDSTKHSRFYIGTPFSSCSNTGSKRERKNREQNIEMKYTVIFYIFQTRKSQTVGGKVQQKSEFFPHFGLFLSFGELWRSLYF
jgi:hypothetical protein